jgi:hypothetical protein
MGIEITVDVSRLTTVANNLLWIGVLRYKTYLNSIRVNTYILII